MKLVDDWKQCLRWWSVRGALVLAILPPVWVSMPPDVKAMLPPEWQPWVLTLIAIGTIAGRMKDQSR